MPCIITTDFTLVFYSVLCTHNAFFYINITIIQQQQQRAYNKANEDD